MVNYLNNKKNNKGENMVALKVNVENLYHKLMKLDFKLKEKYEFNYKNYLVSINVLTNKVIQVSGKHDTDYENNFTTQFIYYKKNEVVKAIKERIDNLIK